MVKELNFDLDVQPELRCPYCGEPAEVDLDPGGADEQTLVQDCAVCCRPWRVHVLRGRGRRGDPRSRLDDKLSPAQVGPSCPLPTWQRATHQPDSAWRRSAE
jgi:hypothetical protein